MRDAAPEGALEQLSAERPDLAGQLTAEQVVLLQHVLFPRVTRYRGCLISARGMAHPFRDDWFDGRHTLPQVEGILNHVVLCDEIDTEDRAIHDSMHAALSVVAEIWRWWLKKETALPFEVWTADNDDEYGPTLGFRSVRGQMKHFVLVYDYVPDFREKRAPYRAAHLAHARAAVGRGELQLGGAFADDPPNGMLLFKGEGPEAAAAFAEADPYVQNGVVTAWRVREWMTVVGPEALTQV